MPDATTVNLKDVELLAVGPHGADAFETLPAGWE